MSQPTIGLALGGGGARGLSHIPVLEAFDELGLRPHAISGASIGAILGAAYACGLSGADIRKIALDTFGERNKVLSSLWQLRPRKWTQMFSGGLMQFDPVTVLDLFVTSHLPASFADLDIPLAIIAADYYGCSEVVLEDGDLKQAIAASIAIPAVFRPVERDGQVLVDGGVVNPLPFDALPVSCDLIVAVDVVGAPVQRNGQTLPSALDSLFGASQILMQTITREKLKSRHPDLLLRPADDNVRVLDFLQTRHILEQASPLKELAKHEIDRIITNHASI
ncbi:patatin-like phospholipase family protein [Roseibium aestuarii]|uniref:Patatin-like phospholipase family protein n=1 Tax=Roseibium aestuarii TaxID=2600299 RepID=A0ABW4JT66_9HYPH|nr:patatin-like phospholipase family protein [Roseibium aestuarii]